jgi:hypothetical protein
VRSAVRPRTQRLRARRRERARIPKCRKCQQKEGTEDASCRTKRKRGNARERDGKPHEYNGQQRDHDQVAQTRQGTCRTGRVAKEGCGADLLRPGQWPEREDQRRQQPVKRSLGEGGRVDRNGDGYGQTRLNDRRERKRQDSAQRNAEPDAHERQEPDLCEVDGEDRARLGAEGFQRRDGGDLAIQIRPYSRRYSDPSDSEPGEADQHQKRPDPVDELLHARRTVARISPAHAGVGEQPLGLGLQCD